MSYHLKIEEYDPVFEVETNETRHKIVLKVPQFEHRQFKYINIEGGESIDKAKSDLALDFLVAKRLINFRRFEKC